MTKEEIIKEIRRTTDENGGVALGKQRFLTATGIRESDWSGRYWSRWSDAVRDAGCTPQAMNQPLSENKILEAAVRIVQSLGHFPTAAELKLETTKNCDLPSHNTFRRFGGLLGLRTKLHQYCTDNGLTDVLSSLPNPSAALVKTDAVSCEAEPSDGFVYLIKSGRFYKIGKANSVDQRHRQLAIQLPDPAEIIHRIKTDDPFGVERYWHHRFASRRQNGEWFALTVADVKVFRRRSFM